MTSPTVEDERVVVVHYRLSDDDGNQIDSSEESQPISYLHGRGQILPGLEQALEGKAAGYQAKIVVAPEDGFGLHQQEFVIEVPRAQFDFEIERGSVIEAQLPDGRSRHLQVEDFSDESVTLDGNHPMAGKTLHFDITVASVREATSEELEHGHVHGGEHDEPCESEDLPQA